MAMFYKSIKIIDFIHKLHKFSLLSLRSPSLRDLQMGRFKVPVGIFAI